MQPKRPLLWLASFALLFAAFQYFTKAAGSVIDAIFQAVIVGIIALLILYGMDKIRHYFSKNHD